MSCLPYPGSHAVTGSMNVVGLATGSGGSLVNKILNPQQMYGPEPEFRNVKSSSITNVLGAYKTNGEVEGWYLDTMSHSMFPENPHHVDQTLLYTQQKELIPMEWYIKKIQQNQNYITIVLPPIY